LQRFSQIIILIFFILFLSIALVTLNSDFIAISIFCFAIFTFDLFYSFSFDKINIECERKIYLLSDNQKISIKNNRFENNQIAQIETKIVIKSNNLFSFFPFYIKIKENIPDRIKLLGSSLNNENIETGFFSYLKSVNLKPKNSQDAIIKSPKYIKISSDFIRKSSSFNSSYFNYSYKVKVKRGFYEFEPVKFKIFSPLFLSSKNIDISANLTFYVVPDKNIDIDFPIRSKKLLVYTGMIPSKKPGIGLNFFDVRQYYEGDKLNTVNWKHSARNNQLYVNEFERESNTDVSIIVDCRNNPNTYSVSDDIFEKGIEAAYTIAKSMLKAQNRVSFLEFGSYFNFVRPGYGKVQLERITMVLSSLKINDQQDFWELDNIPTSIIPSGSLVFLITPLSEEDIPHIIRFHQRKFRFVIVALDIVEYLYNKMDNLEKERYKKAYMLASSLRKMTIETAKKAGSVVLNYNCIEPFSNFIKENSYYLKELTRKAGKI
jgi:uncharacterized protein (DUF58 family)